MYPVTGVTPPPLSTDQMLRLSDEQRAVYFIVFNEVGNKWNRSVMDKHRALIEEFRKKARHCRHTRMAVEKPAPPSGHGEVYQWGSDKPETSDPEPPDPLE